MEPIIFRPNESATENSNQEITPKQADSATDQPIKESIVTDPSHLDPVAVPEKQSLPSLAVPAHATPVKPPIKHAALKVFAVAVATYFVVVTGAIAVYMFTK